MRRVQDEKTVWNFTSVPFVFCLNGGSVVGVCRPRGQGEMRRAYLTALLGRAILDRRVPPKAIESASPDVLTGFCRTLLPALYGPP